jgi:hypothetical protein
MRGRVRQGEGAAPRRGATPPAVAPGPASPTRPSTHKAAAGTPTATLARAACNRGASAKAAAPRITQRPRMGTSFFGRSRLRPCLRSRYLLPGGSSLGPTPGTAQVRSVNDRKFAHIAAMIACRSLRWGAMAAPGVIARVTLHFGCLLRQSRNSWNSSWVAAVGLPATPSCCFMKSWNFVRSSGSCAFRSSHS